MSIFDPLARLVAFVLEQIHRALATFLPASSGWAWGLSIVLLTITVRIVLFPIFVKQIKSQRRMQEIAPKVKALQAKHKGDRETLNAELMKVYAEHGTNPISGCLPMILQLPIFFALFRVMNELRPKSDGSFHGKYGLSDKLIEQAAHAKVFGAPISAAFTSGSRLLGQLGGSSTTVKVVAATMIVVMGLTTFITQRQLMARTGASMDPQQAQVQKIMLYILPFSFAIFGFSFPVGVLLYWLTTNVWSMGQQRYVITRMPPAGATPPAGKDGKAVASDRSGRRTVEGNAEVPAQAPVAEQAPTASTPPPPRPANKAAAGSRKNKKRKGGRR